ncbi:MAG: PAS domain-containing protein, partial [Betaproteobacteria bacterium]|nr:PAS domain-containing protein [Betaproteobacteria bacterium]
MKYFSLRTRMALAISALFVMFVSLISFATLSYFEAEFRNTLEKDQFSLVSSVAANIEEKMKIAQNILVASAESTPSKAIKDPDAAQRFLDAQKGLHTLFDNGIFLISKKGKLIAESPRLSKRRGLDLTFREYYQQTVATKKPYISQPYLATHHPGEPALAITAPIFDKQGKLIAILQGSFLLLGKNIFADLLEVKNGQTGYLYLCDKNRMIILGPFKDRILKPGQARGANIMLDKAVDGFEGSGETVTSFGSKMFVTFKHVHPTGWILASNYPMAEAYAPFYQARSYFIVGVIAMTGLVLFLVWFLMKRFTNPLLAITRHVTTLPSNLENYQALDIDTNDELGALGKAFDSMATSLAIKEKHLQESELNFRALAENANDGMLIAEVDGTIVYVNNQIAELTGYQSPELLALNIKRLVAPEEFHVVDAIHAAVFTGAEAGVYETTLVRKNQVKILVEVSNALTTWAGKMADLLIVRDITERMQAAGALRESQARLDLALRSASMGVWHWDIIENKRHYDDQTCHLLGIDPATFAGTAEELFRAIHPDDRETLRAKMVQTIKLDTPYEMECRVVCPDGSIRYTKTRGKLLRNHDGLPLRISGIIWDISDRVHAGEALRESQARLDLALRSADMGVWSFDLVANKRHYDDQTCHLLGIDPATFAGTAEELFRAIHPDDREMMKVKMAQAIEHDAPYEPDYRAVWPDGSVHYIATRGRLVRDDQGRPLRINGVVFEITDWKEAQNRIYNLAFYDP